MASPAALGAVLARQAEALRALADVTVQQREALRNGRLELLQDLFRELQKIGFSAEALENQRGKMAGELAAQLGCEPKVSAICERLRGEESVSLKERAAELEMAVRKLQSEMQILAGLVDENQRLGGMMIAEWRRLQGMYPSRPGVDFRVRRAIGHVEHFFGLEMGRRAMDYFRRGMETRGTTSPMRTWKGYSPRGGGSTTSPFTNPPSTAQIPGEVGTGVQIDAIVRLRDAFLDIQYREEMTVKGYWDRSRTPCPL